MTLARQRRLLIALAGAGWALALAGTGLPARAQAATDSSWNSAAPEPASGRSAKKLVLARRHMVVTANALASEAGRVMLRVGGNALDAAIAAQLVLGVVEPQSSGIGGGGFLLHYQASTRRMSAWDGRETAPAAATPEHFVVEGRAMRFSDAVASGLSVGVPGALAMLEAAHRAHGRLPWQALFAPALRIADEGFAISPRLAMLIAQDRLLRNNAAARALFFHDDGTPKRAGERLHNRDLARVMRMISRDGAKAFYRGDIAADIVAAVRAAPRPRGSDEILSEADLAAYQARRRETLCGAYRAYRVCGMPPPSSGGTTVAMLLGMLERFPLQQLRPVSADAVHLFAEAGRLAYADRERYLADPDFVRAPLDKLLDRSYLAGRSALIRRERSMGTAAPGAIADAADFGEDRTEPLAATTHLSIVDAEGNAVAFTSSVESAFGSRILVHGFLLNNHLTDFSLLPASGGVPAANRVEPGKRPRSAMAPTLVFDARERLRYVLGSPGGPMIINYVAKTLAGLIDWKMGMQAAIDLPNFGSRNRATEIEKGTALEALVPELRARGHALDIGAQTSGLHGIAIVQDGARRTLQGGADSRREGVALGD